MSIRVIDGTTETVFENVSHVFASEDYNILITYTVDGEPSGPLYTRVGSGKVDILNYLADTEPGVVQNIRLWRLLAVVE